MTKNFYPMQFYGDLVPEDSRETCHRNFHPPRWGWLPRCGTHRGIILKGNLEGLHPLRILHAPGSIWIHGGFSPGKFQTRALQSGAECSTVLVTGLLKDIRYSYIYTYICNYKCTHYYLGILLINHHTFSSI